MTSYYVGQGDNDWVLDVLCSDKDGPVELHNATLIYAFLGSSAEGLICTAVLDYPFDGNPGTSGKYAIARLVGTSAAASRIGTHNGRIQATWADGTIRSFPTTGQYFQFVVTPPPYSS